MLEVIVVILFVIVIGLGIHVNTLTSKLNEKDKEIKDKDGKIDQLSHEQGKLLSIIGHEIKVMLGGLTSTTSSLLTEGNWEKCKQDLEMIVHSSRSLTTYVDDMVDYSNLNTERLKIKKLSFDIRRVIKDTYDILKFEASHNSISLNLLIDESEHEMPEFLIGDPDRIRQLYISLGERAIRFNKGGQVILIAKAEPIEDNRFLIRMIVEDDSSMDHSPLIASANKLSTSNNASKSTGLGLNLVLAQKIIRAMNGNLTSIVDEEGHHIFEGTAELISTDKRLLYPIQDKKNQKFNRNYKKNILIVENEVVNAKILKEILTRLGCSVKIAANGEEGIGKLLNEDNKFDLVFMDIYMPIMDGLTAAEHVKDSITIPIIAVTADANEELEELVRTYGMKGIMRKPITKAMIVQELDKWFN